MKIGIISDTHGLLRKEVIEKVYLANAFFVYAFFL